MHAHKVTILEFAPKRFRFAASHDEAAKIRRDLMAEHQLKMKAVVIEPVDIPTTKAELISFLNSLVNG